MGLNTPGDLICLFSAGTVHTSYTSTVAPVLKLEIEKTTATGIKAREATSNTRPLKLYIFISLKVPTYGIVFVLSLPWTVSYFNHWFNYYQGQYRTSINGTSKMLHVYPR